MKIILGKKKLIYYLTTRILFKKVSLQICNISAIHMTSFCKATLLDYLLGQRTAGQPDLLRTEGQIPLSHTSEFTILIYTYTVDYLRGTTLMGSCGQNVG